MAPLPNTLNLSFRDVASGDIIALLGDRLAVSAGSACHGDRTLVSPVLEAMHVPESYALGAIRISLGHETSDEDVEDEYERWLAGLER